MQDRPTVEGLLGAIAGFLDEEIVPATDGRRQFLARVASNAVRLVDRELANEESDLAAEWERLQGLLGPAPRPIDRGALRTELRRRTEELCSRIRRGEADEGTALHAALVAHVRRTVHDKLVVTNPAWLAADERRAADADTSAKRERDRET